uniref:Uncharacterized protein n=1 Tax=Rhizophora mucronata TaxID=61149 RepID=A0A2P2PLS5_RHIMU
MVLHLQIHNQGVCQQVQVLESAAALRAVARNLLLRLV